MRARKHAFSKYLVPILTLLGSAVLVSGPLWASAAPGEQTTVPNSVSKARAAEVYGRLPLFFIENQGQVDSQVRFFTRGQGHAIFFTPEGVTLNLSRSHSGGKGRKKGKSSEVVQLRPQGMRAGVEILAGEPLPGKVNYLKGNEPGKWHTDVPTYKSVLYREAYPGIDVKFYGAGQQVEYDLVVKPGADPKQAKFLYQGIKSLQVTKAGELDITLYDGGKLVQQAPVIYQEIEGQRVSRQGKFRVLPGTGNRGYGFELASYDARYPLIIDPVTLVYSTYLGGTTWESGNGIAVDASGNAYVVGTTQSTDFPTVAAAQAAFGGVPSDAFISKFNAAGSAMVFSTYLGGDNDDLGMAIALDKAGNAYVTGETSSTNFPLSATPFQNTLNGVNNAFVTKLSPIGAIIFSTYLGGSTDASGLPGTGSDLGKNIAVDSLGAAYVSGDTSSTDFPLSVAPRIPFQNTLKGAVNTFVTKFDTTGAMFYSTYLGGSVSETNWGIGVDSGGRAIVTGDTGSSDFPVNNGSTIKGIRNVYLTNLNTAGSAVNYSTYFGGTGADSPTGGIEVDAAGNAYIAGNTDSADFPTITPFQAALKGFNNAFITKFNVTGTAVYSTFLGGNGTDLAWSIALDPFGNLYITGETNSTNFPVSNAFQAALPNGSCAFVTKFNVTMPVPLIFSTYLGGNFQDFGFGIAVDSTQNAYITGLTESGLFPLKGAIQTTRGGLAAAFVTKMVLIDTTVGFVEELLLKLP